MQNMPIGIFRGDDTDAFSYQTIVGTINTDLDLIGCKAVFRYLGFSMEFDPIPEDRKLTIVIPASETKKFPPGLGYASLRVYDSDGRLKTFSNRIMVFVATKTPMFGSDEFEVDFNVRASLEPLKFFVGPNPDDFDEYRGYVEKVIDRASASKYGLAILLDAIDSDLGAGDGVAATPVAVKAAYAAIIKKLTDDYYTAEQTEEAIDRVAAYYITYDAAGNPFPTYAALANAQTVYSGGKVRVPTRNDYCVVLADETHQGAEYRYIYAVAEGQTTGSWQPQFPVEGVMTIDQTVTRNSQNPVKSGGIWSAIWGALASLPTGFSSLYDWCVAQLAGKASTADATLTEREYSDWSFTPSEFDGDAIKMKYVYGGWQPYTDSYGNLGVRKGDAESTMLTWVEGVDFAIGFTATRTALQGYQLGTQSDKPLASEAEAEALRNGKLDKDGGIITGDLTMTGEVRMEAAEDLKFRLPPGPTPTTLAGLLNGKLDKTLRVFYATCNSSASDTAKVATVAEGDFLLATGSFVVVKFEYANASTVADPTLDVGGTGPKPIYRDATNRSLGSAWTAGESVPLVYDGANWLLLKPAYATVDQRGVVRLSDVVNESSSRAVTPNAVRTAIGAKATGVAIRYATCDTASTVAGKVAIIADDKGEISLDAGAVVVVAFANGLAASNPTLSVGGTAAKPIYRRNGVSPSTYAWAGGTSIEFLYNGNAWIMLRSANATANEFGTVKISDSSTASELTSSQTAVSQIALKNALADKANRASNPTAGNLAALDANGNLTDSQIHAANVALKGNIPYNLGTPIVIDSSAVQTDTTDPNNPITYAAVTLLDRTANFIQISVNIDELRITLPTTTISGKVRDFGLAVEVNSGVTPPAISIPGASAIDNPDGTMPELAEGISLLYFSEFGPYGMMLVKGEQLQQITQ